MAITPAGDTLYVIKKRKEKKVDLSTFSAVGEKERKRKRKTYIIANQNYMSVAGQSYKLLLYEGGGGGKGKGTGTTSLVGHRGTVLTRRKTG